MHFPFPTSYWDKMSYAFTFMWLQMLDLIFKKILQQKCGGESGMRAYVCAPLCVKAVSQQQLKM